MEKKRSEVLFRFLLYPEQNDLIISLITLFLKLRKADLVWKKFLPLRNVKSDASWNFEVG